MSNTLAKEGIGFIYGHNRGYNHINDIAIRILEEDMNVLQRRAIHCPAFTKKFIQGGNHVYSRQEEPFSQTFLEWVQAL